jgi:hypothetical protein
LVGAPYHAGMKVLDLRCANGHGFEGWFGSDDDFMQQNSRGLLACPLCNDQVVTRTPSAPRLNLSGAREPQPPTAVPAQPVQAARPAQLAQVAPPAEMQAAWLHAVRELMNRTEDVGERFAEEARRIHYGEVPQRGIRGQASPEQREALQDEGIETVAIPLLRALTGPLQ